MNRIVTVARVAALVAALAPIVAAAPAADEKAAHPDVGDADNCVTCHEKMTPKVVAQWHAGDHGKFGVKCFVCHGSTGDDFAKVPSVDRCVGCHADAVDSTEASKLENKDCFSCHPSHGLSPHLVAERKEGGRG
jgi:hypothetical protein